MNVRSVGNYLIKKVCSEKAGDAAATIALLSTTTKDLVNCGYYTTQSLNNKKIPEEKRKFVAGIDLSNGILNVLSQLTIGMYIKNKTPAAFDFLFKNSKMGKNAYNAAKGGFSLIVTLVVAQVLLKRILTPFIATPMAHYFKEYADKKAIGQPAEKPKNDEAQTEDVKTQEAKKSEQKEVKKVGLDIVSTSSNSTFKSFEGLLK